MRMLALGLLGACAATAATPAQAQTPRGFEVGVEGFNYGYKEYDGASLFIRDDGGLAGLHLSYVQPLGRHLILRGILAGAAGSIDYDPLDEPVVEDIEQRTGRLELQLGYDFMTGGGANITPFAGIGFRLHQDFSGGAETGSGRAGYDRELAYQYLPIGIAAGIPLGGRKRLTLSGQYNLVVGGQVESRFSEIDPTAPDLELDLDGGRGLEASAILSLPMGSRHLVNIGPFIRRWDINQSESQTIINPDDPAESVLFYEPENRTTEVGIRVSFTF